MKMFLRNKFEDLFLNLTKISLTNSMVLIKFPLGFGKEYL